MGVRQLDVTFDGHLLNDLVTVEDIKRDMAGAFAPETVNVAGRDGKMWRGTRREPLEVTLTLVATGDDYEEVLEKARTLASWFDVDQPAPLEFADEPGFWYLAAPTGQVSLSRIGNQAARVSVGLVCPDACRHGVGGTFDSSDGGVILAVDGTLPTPVRISATSATGNYTVTDQTTGEHITVAVGSAAKALVIDSDKRAATVAGVLKLPTLDSDWLVLAPGAHVLRRTSGAGEFTASYESRWV